MTPPKIINGYPFYDYHQEKISIEECFEKSAGFLEVMSKRRSIRYFDSKAVPKKVIQNILAVANTAPSGANKQPWTFCAVQDPDLKKQIRDAAEKEEYESYNGRMPEDWLNDLAPLQTDWKKPFLETAPWLIVVFKRSYEIDSDGIKRNNYYVSESAGIATGFLIAAIHNAGLVTLTHTPSPMNFLSKLLNRPGNEKPFLLLPVGYAADDCIVPVLKKKSLEEVSVFY
jgi:iodotyrosine deiodinase